MVKVCSQAYRTEHSVNFQQITSNFRKASWNVNMIFSRFCQTALLVQRYRTSRSGGFYDRTGKVASGETKVCPVSPSAGRQFGSILDSRGSQCISEMETSWSYGGSDSGTATGVEIMHCLAAAKPVSTLSHSKIQHWRQNSCTLMLAGIDS